MSQPLSVSPADMAATGVAVAAIADRLRFAMHAASYGVAGADLPPTGWLATPATRQIIAVAFDKIGAILSDLDSTADALATAAAAYEAADGRVANRSRAIAW
jgi:hypothetical protein